jgi:hypothetical protein
MNKEKFKLNGYEHLSLSEVLWLPMDTEELYKQNLKTKFDLLKSQGWVDSNVSYKFNSNGFRSEEFISNNSIVFLGCSFTIGIGLPKKRIFPELVSSAIKLDCYNLGVGGASADTCFRLAYYWLPRIQPKIVVTMLPALHRLELYDNKEFYNHRPTNAKDSKDCILSEEYCYLNQEKNTFAIEQLCNNLKIKFLNYKLERDFVQVPNDFARDLSHLGCKSHSATAQMILSTC